jgi:hypothetical protein
MKKIIELQFAIRWVFYFLLGCALAGLSTHGRAETFFTVREMSFEGGKFSNDAVRNSYLGTPKSYVLSYKTAVNWNVDLMCLYQNDICIFWNNKIDGMASQAAYKYTSWAFTSGVATRYIDLYYDHKSEHVLEEYRPAKTFPVSDAYMIKLKFVFKPRRYWPNND